jgi:hypothetical protein
MKAHAFLTVTGTCYRTIDFTHDLTWVVATCMTAAEAIAIRDVLVKDASALAVYMSTVDSTSTTPLGNESKAMLVQAWLLANAHDPYLVACAREAKHCASAACASWFVQGIVPTYDIYRTFDDFTQRAELVTGEESDPTPEVDAVTEAMHVDALPWKLESTTEIAVPPRDLSDAHGEIVQILRSSDKPWWKAVLIARDHVGIGSTETHALSQLIQDLHLIVEAIVPMRNRKQ